MPAPTNTSALTAIDIGTSLPYATTQDAHFAGVTYSLWYSYTAQPGDNVIGVFGYGTIGSGYGSFLSVYTGPAAAPVLYLINTANRNRCVYFPVTPGTTYYFEFEKSTGNPSPAILTINIQARVDSVAPVGSIGINDDTPGFPLALLSPTTSPVSVLRYVQSVAAGEHLATLDSGIVASEDTATSETVIYAADYSEIARVAQSGRAITSNQVDRFYTIQTVGANRRVLTLDATGTVLATSGVLSTAIIDAIAVSPDGAILYYFRVTGASPLHRWDLVNDVALTDLLNLNNVPLKDCYCLTDGRIVTVNATTDLLTLFHPDGTTSAAFALPCSPSDRFCRDLTDGACYVWRKQNVRDHEEDILRMSLTTGAVSTTLAGYLFTGGIYDGAETATPGARFSNSSSCPIWVIPTAVGPLPGSILVQKVTSPGGLPDLFDFTAGGGLSPGSFQLADGGSQLYDPVAVGSGYSIVETPAAGFSTLVSVSNGSPNTNISVGEGEAVVVTVTNAQQVAPGGGDGCPLGAPAAVTGENGCTIPNDF